MMSYLIYMLLLHLAAYGIYELLLKRTTFFGYNRWYLLIIAVLLWFIPFINISALNTVVEKPVVAQTTEISDLMNDQFIILDEYESSEIIAQTEKTSFQFSWWYVYALGIIISLILFLRNYQHLRTTKKLSTYLTRNESSFYLIPNSHLAFSFHGQIFIGELIKESQWETIIAHEKEHIDQKHHWDLWFYSALRILLWFNPFVYLFQSRLKLVHEHLVDHKMLQQLGKDDYTNLLLNNNFETQQIAIANSFYTFNTLKTRITMMLSHTTPRLQLIRYFSIIILVVSAIIYTSCTTKKEATDDEKFINDFAIAYDNGEFQLPLYSEFKAGEKDFFKGISTEDSLFLASENLKRKEQFGSDSISKDNREKFLDSFSTYMKSESGRKYMDIFSDIRNNGISIVIDDSVEPNEIMTIFESYESDNITYGSFPMQYQTGLDDQKYEQFKIWAVKNYPYLESMLSINEEIANGTITTVEEIQEIPQDETSKKLQEYLNSETGKKVMALAHGDFSNEAKKDSITVMLEQKEISEEEYREFIMWIKGETNDSSTAISNDGKTLYFNTDTEAVPFGILDDSIAPSYGNCENTYTAKECLNQVITVHVQDNFNRDLNTFKNQVKLTCQFVINKKGNVEKIQVRAPSKKLQNELIRVINTLPQFTPAMVNGKPISVVYALPIILTGSQTDLSTRAQAMVYIKNGTDPIVKTGFELPRINECAVINEDELLDCLVMNLQQKLNAKITSEFGDKYESAFTTINFDINDLGFVENVKVSTVDEPGDVLKFALSNYMGQLKPFKPAIQKDENIKVSMQLPLVIKNEMN